MTCTARALTRLTLAAALAMTAACSSREGPTPAALDSPAATAGASSDTAPEALQTAPTNGATRPAPSQDRATAAPVDRPRTALQELYFRGHPQGSGDQIALRFMQALQREQYLDAAAELYVVGRTYFATEDEVTLRLVLGDVRRNARLGAAACTGTARLDATSAAVTCGDQVVVVHVLQDAYGSGVQLSAKHPRFDQYAGPHTHAFTTLGP